MDIVLGPGPDGRTLAHRLDCPIVNMLRAAGEPLMTLFEVKPTMVAALSCKHSCLDDQEGE